MSIIYILSTGSDDEYTILATTTDKKVAERLSKKLSADLTVHPDISMNDLEAVANKKYYYVRMWKSGILKDQITESTGYLNHGIKTIYRISADKYQKIEDDARYLMMYTWAESQEDAANVAELIRQELLDGGKFRQGDWKSWE